MSTPNHNPIPDALSQASWRKSSYSGGANDCVELAQLGAYVAIRDSKNLGVAPVVIRQAELRAFIDALVRAGARFECGQLVE